MINIFKMKIEGLFNDAHFGEILRGTTFTFSAKIAMLIVGIVSNIIITRYYGAKIMGILAIINSILVVGSIFPIMGTNVSILRLIPEHVAKYSFRSAQFIYKKIIYAVIGLSFLIALIILVSSDFIALRIFSKGYLSYLIALSAVFLITQTIYQINTEAIRAFKEIRLYAFVQFLPSALNLLFLMLLTFTFYNKYNPIYIQFLIFTIGALITHYFIRRIFLFRINSNPEQRIKKLSYSKIISISFPMFLTGAMHLVIGQTDIIMLGIMRSEAEVGVYAVALKLAMLTSFVLISINSIAAPKFSELYHSNKIDELSNIAQKSSKFVFWTTTPILIFLILFGKLVLGIFGKEFVIGYVALVLLVLGQFINSAAGSVGYFLDMTGHQKAFLNIIIFSGILNAGLNLILIPIYGIYGAAFASMVSISFWNIAAAIYIRNKFGFLISYFPLFSNRR